MTSDTLWGAIIGAFFSFVLPIVWDWIKLRRSPLRPATGVWISKYQTGLTTKNWKDEVIEISYKFGQLKLKSIKNELGHQWEGKAKVVDNRLLVGELRSVKLGARTLTSFILVIHQQGDYLYGRWIKTSTKNIVITGRWVLGRTEADVEMAKNQTETANKMIP